MKLKVAFALFFLASTVSFAQERVWSLEECVNYALEHNLSVKRTKLNVESADIEVKASWSNFLPNLNANASQNLSFGSSISPESNLRVPANFTSTNGGLNSSTNVFNGFRNISEYRRAKVGVESSKLELEKMQNDISLNVVNSYLTILFDKENLEVAQTQKRISQEQVDRIKALVDAGSSPRSDLYDIEATLANDIQNEVMMQNALDLSLLNMTQLLQIPSDNFDVEAVDVGSPSFAMAAKNSSVIYEKALQIMPEIKKAQMDYESTDFDIKLAKSGFYPSLGLSLGMNSFYNRRLSDANPELYDSFGDQMANNVNYNVGLSMSIPIFNRNQNKANVKRATITQRRSELDLAQEKQTLYQNIESAFLDAKSATKTFEAAKTSLKSQLEAFRNAEERFNVGAMTSYDFNQTRNGLVNAQATLIRAKYDYVFKMKLLRFYYGEPLMERNW
ncbi:MAG: TolC family protein [Flavobacteriaceae bacterium]